MVVIVWVKKNSTEEEGCGMRNQLPACGSMGYTP